MMNRKKIFAFGALGAGALLLFSSFTSKKTETAATTTNCDTSDYEKWLACQNAAGGGSGITEIIDETITTPTTQDTSWAGNNFVVFKTPFEVINSTNRTVKVYGYDITTGKYFISSGFSSPAGLKNLPSWFVPGTTNLSDLVAQNKVHLRNSTNRFHAHGPANYTQAIWPFIPFFYSEIKAPKKDPAWRFATYHTTLPWLLSQGDLLVFGYMTDGRQKSVLVFTNKGCIVPFGENYVSGISASPVSSL